MSEPVRIGDLIAETLADLRKRADGYTGNGAVRETMVKQSEAGSASTEHRPLATISNQRKGREGHHA